MIAEENRFANCECGGIFKPEKSFIISGARSYFINDEWYYIYTCDKCIQQLDCLSHIVKYYLQRNDFKSAWLHIKDYERFVYNNPNKGKIISESDFQELIEIVKQRIESEKVVVEDIVYAGPKGNRSKSKYWDVEYVENSPDPDLSPITEEEMFQLFEKLKQSKLGSEFDWLYDLNM